MILIKLKSVMVFLLICIHILIISNNNSKANYTFTYNNKSYEIVETKYSWEDAAKNAADKGGYLVHIDSKEEQAAVYEAIINGAKINVNYTYVMDGGGVAYLWIGANDLNSEGTWVWDGDNSGDGDNFWNGQGSAGLGNGSAVDGKFYNWGGKEKNTFPSEPDDFYEMQDAAGIALSDWPYGKASEWNDISETNKIYSIIEFNYTSKPGKPGKPVGTETLCQNAANTGYKTNEVANAESYVWDLSPSTAGIAMGNTANINIVWNKDFYGTAELTVAATNPLGTSDVSEKLIINVKPRPKQCEIPKGLELLCENPENSTYKITGISGITNYAWTLEPISAGIISGTSLEVVIDWRDDFKGTARLFVAGINDCGNGENSPDLLVKINEKPIQPTKPTGKENIVQNGVNTVYTTLGSSSSQTYKWNIEPSDAGVILGDSLSATVDWSELFSGQAKISVSGLNNCGEGYVSESLIVTVSEKPAKANKPSGIVSICQGSSNTEYSTKPAEGAVGYLWKIDPVNAGSILGEVDTIYVLWNKDFSGKVKLFVASKGQLKNGDFSDTLIIDVKSKPTKCSNPEGLIKLCNSSVNTEYNTNLNSSAESYEWTIIPENAGTVIGKSNSIKIDWKDDFIGKASISVVGVNTCGKGIVSNSLQVEVFTKPKTPQMPSGKTSIPKNSSNTEYVVEASDDADTYAWKITPASAGTINGSSLKGVVDWNNNFTGEANISVKAMNTCGESVYSQNLNVVVSDTVQVSVDDLNQQFDFFKIFPNPVSDLLNIEILIDQSENALLRIFNILGIQIKTIQLKQGKNLIDITNLPIGKYYCIYGTLGQTITKSFEIIR